MCTLRKCLGRASSPESARWHFLACSPGSRACRVPFLGITTAASSAASFSSQRKQERKGPKDACPSDITLSSLSLFMLPAAHAARHPRFRLTLRHPSFFLFLAPFLFARENTHEAVCCSAVLSIRLDKRHRMRNADGRDFSPSIPKLRKFGEGLKVDFGFTFSKGRCGGFSLYSFFRREILLEFLYWELRGIRCINQVFPTFSWTLGIYL